MSSNFSCFPDRGVGSPWAKTHCSKPSRVHSFASIFFPISLSLQPKTKHFTTSFSLFQCHFALSLSLSIFPSSFYLSNKMSIKITKNCIVLSIMFPILHPHEFLPNFEVLVRVCPLHLRSYKIHQSSTFSKSTTIVVEVGVTNMSNKHVFNIDWFSSHFAIEIETSRSESTLSNNDLFTENKVRECECVNVWVSEIECVCVCFCVEMWEYVSKMSNCVRMTIKWDRFQKQPKKLQTNIHFSKCKIE
jgi:hypothetical protein